MGAKTWIGGATAVKQVATVTFGSDTSGHVYNFVLTDEVGGTATATFTSTGGGTTADATGLKNAINASTDPRFAAIQPVSSTTNVVTITANTAGTPFYASISGSGVGDMTLATTTPNSGPNDFASAANYAENAIPVNNDDLTLTGSSNISFGLVTGLSLHGFKSLSSYSGAVGSAGKYLQFTCTSFNWAGSGKAYINIGSSSIGPNVTQTATATAPDSGLFILGSAMGVLAIAGNSSVDVAGGPGQTSTVTTIQLQTGTGSNGQARVNVGSGVTLTNLYQVSGNSSTLNCAATSVIVNNGTLTTWGTGAITTLTTTGGTTTVTSNSSGTITNLNIRDGGTVDMLQSDTARTVTNATVVDGTYKFDASVVTNTNGVVTGTGVGPQTVTVASA